MNRCRCWMMSRTAIFIAALGCFLNGSVGLPTNRCLAQNYKQLPPAGMEIDAQTRGRLTLRVKQLEAAIGRLSKATSGTTRGIPDVEVLTRAVRLALEQNLFYKDSEVEWAAKLLEEAEQRLDRFQKADRGLALLGLADQPIDEPQMLVGGFRSRIDDSVQPYGLVVPAGYDASGSSHSSHRVDVWLHGRGDTKTEIPFIGERMSKVGQYAPKDTFVLHPFGRHCNAFKFAGETDVYEAIDHLDSLVSIDRQRMAIRGFSMGGAGCWHFAVHDPGRWFAANPGAGFVDTLVYQGWTEKTPFEIDATRQKLLRWYDVLPWTSNLSNTRVVAYSGEVDKQKQAADRVIASEGFSGVEHEYVIGAKMGHKIDKPSAEKIDTLLAKWASQPLPSPRRKIDMVTYTLRYNQVEWLQVTGLLEHWTAGRVKAEQTDANEINVQTEGITGLRFDFSRSGAFDGETVTVNIDGDRLAVSDSEKPLGLQCQLVRKDGWHVLDGDDETLRKRPGLQGPIDDAFCERFIFVTPSRPATHGVVQRWIDREIDYAKSRWRRLMRGEVREVTDIELSEDQIANCNLICFGDFGSNQFLRQITAGLPIDWTRDELRVGDQQFDPATHAAVMCFPNPRNPDRYVVVNSGMTFREFSNNSNSRQIAMLPDWAVIDVCQQEGVPAGGIFPGKIAAHGFFDETWSLPAANR